MRREWKEDQLPVRKSENNVNRIRYERHEATEMLIEHRYGDTRRILRDYTPVYVAQKKHVRTRVSSTFEESNQPIESANPVDIV